MQPAQSRVFQRGARRLTTVGTPALHQFFGAGDFKDPAYAAEEADAIVLRS
jgi:hypothetical protein